MILNVIYFGNVYPMPAIGEENFLKKKKINFLAILLVQLAIFLQ